ncbi:MAG: sugar isomerase domain-containing protein [Methylotenera sp.]|nr:sugar isomerase domain-containing protein [Oligoflexia bacterium]
MNQKNSAEITVKSYSEKALPHLASMLDRNTVVMQSLVDRLVSDVKAGKSLFVFGSGHSGLFPLELYHRAGGASFVIPVVADYLLPTAGPSVVRVLERTPGAANAILSRAQPREGEMIWISSQSGVNSAVVDFALDAKKRGLHTVAFTSVVHSSGVPSRHASGKRLYEVCDETVDLGGHVGDACVSLSDTLRAGPLSMLGSVFMGHSILVAACAVLEASGTSCVYTSVNTPEGESRNQEIEKVASLRDPLLR